MRKAGSQRVEIFNRERRSAGMGGGNGLDAFHLGFDVAGDSFKMFFAHIFSVVRGSGLFPYL